MSDYERRAVSTLGIGSETELPIFSPIGGGGFRVGGVGVDLTRDIVVNTQLGAEVSCDRPIESVIGRGPAGPQGDPGVQGEPGPVGPPGLNGIEIVLVSAADWPPANPIDGVLYLSGE